MPKRTSDYPDLKAIISGYFKPLDETRCLVCGKELGVTQQEQHCGDTCWQRLLKIQRAWSMQAIGMLLRDAEKGNDPRLLERKTHEIANTK